MGKAYQGVFGSFSGKVGNVVGRVLQGEQVYAIYQPKVANPRTEEQVVNRQKFTILVSHFKVMLQAIRVGFKKLDGYRLGNPFSSAIGYNLRNGLGFVLEGNEYVFNPATAVVAEGSTPIVGNATVAVEGTDLNFAWNYNAQFEKGDDDVYAVLFSKEKNQAIFAAEPSTRQGRTLTVSAPVSWVGMSIDTWVFAVSKDGMPSLSVSTGTITL